MFNWKVFGIGFCGVLLACLVMGLIGVDSDSILLGLLVGSGLAVYNGCKY